MNIITIVIALAIAVGVVYVLRRFSRFAPARGIDVGEVSTRWLADKRREGKDDRG
jgi:hypothetical protein